MVVSCDKCCKWGRCGEEMTSTRRPQSGAERASHSGTVGWMAEHSRQKSSSCKGPEARDASSRVGGAACREIAACEDAGATVGTWDFTESAETSLASLELGVV